MSHQDEPKKYIFFIQSIKIDLKYEFESSVRVKNLEIGTISSGKGKNAFQSPTHVILIPGYVKETFPKFLKPCQITKFNMTFQKSDISSQFEEIDFDLKRELGDVTLKNLTMTG